MNAAYVINISAKILILPDDGAWWKGITSGITIHPEGNMNVLLQFNRPTVNYKQQPCGGAIRKCQGIHLGFILWEPSILPNGCWDISVSLYKSGGPT